MGVKLRIPENHPRAKSLKERMLIIECEKKGIVAKAGLIAHGRGEAFDYIIGENTIPPALFATKAAAAAMLLAKRPVISVNGNAAALVPKELVMLSKELNAPLEVNLFFRTKRREEAIKKHLLAHGAELILGVGRDASAIIPELFSERRRVDPRGIYSADVVLVPLEDGDRTYALKKMGKFVIAIDLNPLSRTAQTADITIVDNIVRAIPNMLRFIEELKGASLEDLESIVSRFDNKKNLSETIIYIRDRLTKLSREGN
ncbi:MAG: phosphopantothenate/pantothenate synthetase [Candidatus Methanomethyliaceae archaeon]|nr:phosphopantothenate/pantothenate synthetase [Candidatus Methanomethyliaceae archaeon]MCX8169753.1 4-phosphopantoate--beta-alanine ligase [Candidatus Methanomethyliaceae archaeon]MDW7970491.1 4-phosphopantoate--beta-alanine ligase [Nitrososphaerota archaeon]